MPNGVVGILLAGGKSSRMGGGDKCLRPLGGKPILARIIDRLSPQVADIVINANGDPSRFSEFGLPVVADSVAGFQGPLAGVLAGLRWVRANRPGVDHAVTIATDTPFFPADLVQRFLESSGNVSGFRIAQSDAGVHPVIGFWPVALCEDLEASLKRGERKVTSWTRDHGAVPVFFPPVDLGPQSVDPFFNINAPEDLATAEAIVGEAAS
jgi:molybdenum cofactor guanylyltransferase